MIGNPKFKKGQLVEFTVNGENIKGIVFIVDAYGTFEQSDEVSYDVFVEEHNNLYKHLRESILREVK